MQHRGMEMDSPQDVAETERQRRVVSPDKTDPFQLGMCGGVCRGGKWQGGRGSPDVWAGWWREEGGGRREEGADWTKVECREKISALLRWRLRWG